MAKIIKTMDGNAAATYTSYAFTEVAGIFPITPSSQMAELADEMSANGVKNMFGQTVEVIEMQSEAGAAGTVHGSLQAGALTTTFTASQGLLLKIPNMYKIAGELLPCVIHVSARAIAGHALSIFGDHSDVMAARQTGFAMLASNSVQEVADLSAVAHLSTLKGKVPFIHFFDGFRTSHEIQKVECLEYSDFADLVDMDAVEEFRRSGLNPESPVTRGSAQNPDIFFQGKEASNKYYNELPAIVEDYMDKINKLTGRDYQLFNYYGAKDADRVIIAMGSGVEAIEETVDYLNSIGEKVGVIKVRLFRPFSLDHFVKSIPASATKIAVLDRTKEPGSLGEPLYQDVCTALVEKDLKLTVVGGRYALGSKDFTPAQVVAVFNNLKEEKPKNHFTVGIVDDVTHTSLEVGDELDLADADTKSCKFWGLGSDGTIGANKNSIKIIGDNTDLYAQAYFSYDSKKSGGITQSHLRFGKKPIRSTYLVNKADFVACHKPSYLEKYDMLKDIKENGTFLLNCSWSVEELESNLPANVKRQIANKNIKFYTLDATSIAKEIGLGNRVNTILQAGFFNLTKIIPTEDAVKYMKNAIQKSYGNKGEKIVNMNNQAVDKGITAAVQVTIPSAWSTAKDVKKEANKEEKPVYVSTIVDPINALKGDDLPVSTFMDFVDGTMPNGTAAYEKRGIAVDVPEWIADKCIQCNQCAYVCPHSCIRPFIATDESLANKPEGYETIKGRGKGLENYNYRMQVDTLDCTGCGNCVQICPAKEKALVMEPMETQMKEMENWYYSLNLPVVENPINKETVKGSQFETPLFEFSGACAGCGETPYAKLLTQLFGDRMYIANATGCSSIWGASSPATPYTTNHKGQGPAWANSLFEDNAEFGLGMLAGQEKIREGVKANAEELSASTSDSNVKNAITNWIDTYNDGEASKLSSLTLIDTLAKAKLSGTDKKLAEKVLKDKNFLNKKSQWILGGDGWAYDIGYGGLDHVLASGRNVNVLVFDTEVYSNTGGQSSKSSPRASVAKFAASGKRLRKKDLGLICMSYGYVYVAQVAMGANQNQLIKAMVEAEKYDGPSLIIAYSPCIAHGIKGGLFNTQAQTKKAVECGYWHLYRYNPLLEEQGKNPFILDSKEPNGKIQEFINSEVRYTSLRLAFPDVAEELFTEMEKDCNRRYESYKRLEQAKW